MRVWNAVKNWQRRRREWWNEVGGIQSGSRWDRVSVALDAVIRWVALFDLAVMALVTVVWVVTS